MPKTIVYPPVPGPRHPYYHEQAACSDKPHDFFIFPWELRLLSEEEEALRQENIADLERQEKTDGRAYQEDLKAIQEMNPVEALVANKFVVVAEQGATTGQPASNKFDPFTLCEELNRGWDYFGISLPNAQNVTDKIEKERIGIKFRQQLKEVSITDAEFELLLLHNQLSTYLIGHILAKNFDIRLNAVCSLASNKGRYFRGKDDQLYMEFTQCNPMITMSVPGLVSKTIPGETKMLYRLTPRGPELQYIVTSNTILKRMLADKQTSVINDKFVSEAHREEQERKAIYCQVPDQLASSHVIDDRIEATLSSDKQRTNEACQLAVARAWAHDLRGELVLEAGMIIVAKSTEQVKQVLEHFPNIGERCVKDTNIILLFVKHSYLTKAMYQDFSMELNVVLHEYEFLTDLFSKVEHYFTHVFTLSHEDRQAAVVHLLTQLQRNLFELHQLSPQVQKVLITLTGELRRELRYLKEVDNVRKKVNFPPELAAGLLDRQPDEVVVTKPDDTFSLQQKIFTALKKAHAPLPGRQQLQQYVKLVTETDTILDEVKSYIEFYLKAVYDVNPDSIQEGDDGTFSLACMPFKIRRNPKIYTAILALGMIDCFRKHHPKHNTNEPNFQDLKDYEAIIHSLHAVLQRNNDQKKWYQGNRFADGFTYTDGWASIVMKRVTPRQDEKASKEYGIFVGKGMTAILGKKPPSIFSRRGNPVTYSSSLCSVMDTFEAKLHNELQTLKARPLRRRPKRQSVLLAVASGKAMIESGTFIQECERKLDGANDRAALIPIKRHYTAVLQGSDEYDLLLRSAENTGDIQQSIEDFKAISIVKREDHTFDIGFCLMNTGQYNCEVIDGDSEEGRRLLDLLEHKTFNNRPYRNRDLPRLRTQVECYIKSKGGYIPALRDNDPGHYIRDAYQAYRGSHRNLQRPRLAQLYLDTKYNMTCCRIEALKAIARADTHRAANKAVSDLEDEVESIWLEVSPKFAHLDEAHGALKKSKEMLCSCCKEARDKKIDDLSQGKECYDCNAEKYKYEAGLLATINDPLAQMYDCVAKEVSSETCLGNLQCTLQSLTTLHKESIAAIDAVSIPSRSGITAEDGEAIRHSVKAIIDNAKTRLSLSSLVRYAHNEQLRDTTDVSGLVKQMESACQSIDDTIGHGSEAGRKAKDELKSKFVGIAFNRACQWCQASLQEKFKARDFDGFKRVLQEAPDRIKSLIPEKMRTDGFIDQSLAANDLTPSLVAASLGVKELPITHPESSLGRAYAIIEYYQKTADGISDKKTSLHFLSEFLIKPAIKKIKLNNASETEAVQEQTLSIIEKIEEKVSANGNPAFFKLTSSRPAEETLDTRASKTTGICC